MLKLILKGGLGNQMFQYAAVYSLAKKRNLDFSLDLSFIKNRIPVRDFTYREFELDLFNITTPTTTFLRNSLLDRYFSYPLEIALFSANLLKQYRERDIYRYDYGFFSIPDDVYIEGYFNNYRYFAPYETDIKECFSLDTFFTAPFEDIASEITNSNSVSINIRRGDYLNSKHKDVYITLQQDYYRQAISIIRERIDKPHFYIFSYDDPEWFKNVLQLKNNEFTFLGKEYVGEKFKTYLRFISLCKHNIISNSTFAFWGAYLNKNRDKVVVAPKKWMNTGSDFETPPDWIAI